MATPQGSLTVNRVLVGTPLASARPDEGAAGSDDARAREYAGARRRSRRRVLWIIGLRPILLSVVIVTALLIDLPESISLLSPQFGGFLLAVTYLLTGGYAATRGLIHRYPWIVEAQLVVNVVMVSVIVLLTGGFESHFVPLYMLPILGGGVTRLSRGGMTIASVSGLVFAMLVASQFGLVVPQPQEWGLTVPTVVLPTPRFAFYSVALTAAGFLVVGRPDRVSRREPASGRHAAANARRTTPGGSAGLQPARDRQHDRRPGGHGRARPGADGESRRGDDYWRDGGARARPIGGRSAAAARRVPPIAGGHRRPRPHPARGISLSAAQRPDHRSRG